MPDRSPQEQQEGLLVSTGETIDELQQTDENTARTPDADHSRIRLRLYTSHALSTWNSRLFEFGAFLFLAKIYPLTLLPASVYALARAAAAALISPSLGSYIDTADRLRAVRLSILGQRLPVVLSCVGFLIMLMYPDRTQSLVGKTLALSLLSILACMEKLSAVLNTISVERDWVVVVAGADETRLATMNAQMRRIDLFCKLVAPLAISLVDSYSTKVAAIVTAALSVASVSIECFAIARVYQAVPALRHPKSSDEDTSSRQPVSAKERLVGAAAVVSTYVRHPAFLPSFALALLYLTVLSFSGQLITYLLAQDMSSASVALLRGVAAMFELSATWLGPWLHKRIGAVRSGIWFLNAELFFVSVACGILWLPDEHKSKLAVTLTLVSMVILSRTGLWGFDLSAQLIIQDEVEPDVRGTFSSLEASCQNIFEMLAFLSTIIFPRPEQFKIPAAISAGAVATAALLFAYFVRKRRGHLLHASRCLERRHSSKERHRSWEALPQEELQDLRVGREARA